MSEHKTKELRKALRNVVQDLLPEILQGEVVGAVAKELQKQVVDRLDVIDKRQKDIQSYMLRQVNEPAAQPPTPVASAPAEPVPPASPNLDRIPD